MVSSENNLWIVAENLSPDDSVMKLIPADWWRRFKMYFPSCPEFKYGAESCKLCMVSWNLSFAPKFDKDSRWAMKKSALTTTHTHAHTKKIAHCGDVNWWWNVDSHHLFPRENEHPFGEHKTPAHTKTNLADNLPVKLGFPNEKKKKTGASQEAQCKGWKLVLKFPRTGVTNEKTIVIWKVFSGRMFVKSRLRCCNDAQ